EAQQSIQLKRAPAVSRACLYAELSAVEIIFGSEAIAGVESHSLEFARAGESDRIGLHADIVKEIEITETADGVHSPHVIAGEIVEDIGVGPPHLRLGLRDHAALEDAGLSDK